MSASVPQQSRRVTSAAIVNALPHAVVVLDGDDAVIAANDAAQAFFSASLSVLRKRPLSAFVPFGSPLLELPAKVRAANSAMVEYRVELSSPKVGRGLIVDIHAVPLPEDPSVVILTLDRPSMAEKIDRVLPSRTAARSVTGLAAMLAHELRNPLSGIRGAAQLIEPALSEDDRALARLITAETDRIVKLVDRMEVFGDMRPVQRSPVNIHDVLDHVAQLAETGVARHATITKQYDPSLPPVNANRDQLVQVFLNLVKNAAEALPAGGQIALTTAYRPGMRVPPLARCASLIPKLSIAVAWHFLPIPCISPVIQRASPRANGQP